MTGPLLLWKSLINWILTFSQIKETIHDRECRVCTCMRKPNTLNQTTAVCKTTCTLSCAKVRILVYNQSYKNDSKKFQFWKHDCIIASQFLCFVLFAQGYKLVMPENPADCCWCQLINGTSTTVKMYLGTGNSLTISVENTTSPSLSTAGKHIATSKEWKSWKMMHANNVKIHENFPA